MVTHCMPQHIRLLLISSSHQVSAETETLLHQQPGLLARVWHSTHLHDALQALADLNGRVDAIMVDHDLLSGHKADEVMTALEEANGRAPIIVFNAPHLLDRVTELLAAGAISCISRYQAESDPSRLRTTLIKAIVRRQAMSEREKQVRESNLHLREQSHQLEANCRQAQREREEIEWERQQLVSWLSGSYMIQE